MSGDAKKCEFCDKRGVPILPLRYAVAPEGVGLPKASPPGTVAIEKGAFYTRRLLRTGYLYVFDEARNRWDAYFVTPQGLFFKIASTPGVIPILPKKPFDCPDMGHRAVASCITIPDAKNATNVWLGFSDVQWTKDVFDRHARESYRKRHMRCVDVKAFASSVDKAHTLGIHTVASHVAEYAQDKTVLKKVLNWSPFDIDPRKEQTDRLIREAENLSPGKGFAVVLDDPAGVAQELALLMKRNHDLFVANPDRKRGVTINGVIEEMELAIKQQGERDRLKQARREAVNITNPGYMGAGDGAGSAAAGMALARAFNKRLDDSLSEIEEDIRNVPSAELDLAADKAWKKYADKINPTEREKWRSEFETSLKEYDEKFIAPLAVAHRDWMKHASTLAYFECNYDEGDVRTGEVYTAVMQHCIATTADKKACFDLYTDWLKGDLADTSNLLLQALTYNHKPTREQIVASVSGGVDWRGLSWDKVLEAFDKATASLQKGSADVLGRLIGSIAGPVAAGLVSAAGSSKVYAGLVALGAAARQPIVLVEVTGGRKAFRAMLIREMFRLHGQPIDSNKMQFAVAEELRRLKMHGVPLDGTDKKQWLLMIDPAEVKSMPKGLGPTARAQWLAKSIRTPEQVEALNLQNFRLKVANASTAIGGGVPMAFGVLGVVANWVALNSTREGEIKAMAHAKGEGLRRVYAQGAQLIGAIASTIETAVARIPVLAARAGQGLAAVGMKVVGFVGKLLGVGGSMVMAGIDIWRMGNEIRENNFKGMVAYGVSGLLGATATLLLLFGSTGIGLIFVGLMFIWAFVMPMLVDDGLQDWLERCLWGNLPKERYPGLDQELAELKAATS